jgi:hypothetical protein
MLLVEAFFPSVSVVRLVIMFISDQRSALADIHVRGGGRGRAIGGEVEGSRASTATILRIEMPVISKQ